MEKYTLNERTRQNLRKRSKQSEISNQSDKWFKVMIVKMPNKLRRRVDEHSENLTGSENTKKNQMEWKYKG